MNRIRFPLHTLPTQRSAYPLNHELPLENLGFFVFQNLVTLIGIEVVIIFPLNSSSHNGPSNYVPQLILSFENLPMTEISNNRDLKCTLLTQNDSDEFGECYKRFTSNSIWKKSHPKLKGLKFNWIYVFLNRFNEFHWKYNLFNL